MTSLATLICLTGFAAGCDQNNAALTQGPLFCDVEVPRVFTEAELQARAPFPENLRRDLATNERGRDHCGWGQSSGL